MGALELHSPPFVGANVSSAPSYCRAGPGICEFSRGRLFRHSGDLPYGDCAFPDARFGEIAEIRPVCRKSGNPDSPVNPNFPSNRRFSRKSPKSGRPPRNRAVGFSQFYANCRYSGRFGPLGRPAQRRIPRILDCGCDWRCAFCAVSSGAGFTGYFAHQLRAPDLSGIWRSMPRRQF